MGHNHDSRHVYEAYWRGLGRQRTSEQLKTTVWFVLGLQALFSLLDYWAFPEHIRLFLGLRMTVNILLVAILLRWRLIWPRLSEIVLSTSVGAEILAMIYTTGGPESRYYTGLIILFVGMPVLLLLRPRDVLGVTSVFCAGFVASPWIAGHPFSSRGYAISVVFVVSGAIESVVSCSLLTRARLKDFLRESEVERARDELQELDRTKSRFTANVHHELRTPLTLMLAPLDAMLAGDVTDLPEVQGYLKTMRINGLRLLKLINNLLDLAKAESGRLALHRRPLDAGRFVVELVSGARPMAERKSIELELSGLGELPQIHADPEALEDVVVNLVGNALKFTPAGGRIRVRGEAQGDGIHLTVSDSGIGIPEDKLERIFDRFAQVDASTTRRYEGTGIGLSLAKELVEMHGGRIWAESPGLGKGTTLHVVLPKGQPDEGLEEEVVADSSGEGVALGRSFAALEAEIDLAEREGSDYKLAELTRTVARQTEASESTPAPRVPIFGSETSEVLVAEDNPEMRRLLSFLVGREFRVRTARNGREALEMIRERPPDLVLTDIMMPELSGTDLCRAIKADPALRSIPVVLITSKAEREMKIQGLELGAEDYVIKPFHPRELLARVRSLIRLREYELQLVRAERLAAVGELAAGVAHEVNNPVNFAVNALGPLRKNVLRIGAWAEQLSGLDLDDPVKLRQQIGELRNEDAITGLSEMASELNELVEIASEGLHRTNRLVGELRDFARPGHGPREACDLARSLRSTVHLLGYALQHGGVQVEFDLPGSLPTVPGDAAALNQVFLNILKNAVEALEKTGGTIRITAAQIAEGVRVEIHDDGPGLAAEIRDRLFQPFATTKGRGRGTGLGLSMSHRIVTEHGGQLDVRSAPGTGTCFIVTLPIETRDAA